MKYEHANGACWFVNPVCALAGEVLGCSGARRGQVDGATRVIGADGIDGAGLEDLLAGECRDVVFAWLMALGAVPQAVKVRAAAAAKLAVLVWDKCIRVSQFGKDLVRNGCY